MGDINRYGEAISVGTNGCFTTDDGETGKQEFGWYLATGMERDRDKCGGDPGCKDVHYQETSDGVEAGGCVGRESVHRDRVQPDR